MADPNPSRDAGSGGVLPFEATLGRLETIVEQLEAGDLPLEEALRVFEEGVSLSRRCAEELEAADRRVEELVGSEVRPFEPAEDDA